MSAKTRPDAASARREQPLPAGVGSAPAVRDRDRRDGLSWSACRSSRPAQPPPRVTTAGGERQPGAGDRDRVIVVMPAYNAALTVERTVRDIPRGLPTR